MTIKDSHPLPQVDDTLDALAGATWFSTLDFSDGYWQVEVAARACTSSKPCPWGSQMHHICMIYLDDILIYSHLRTTSLRLGRSSAGLEQLGYD